MNKISILFMSFMMLLLTACKPDPVDTTGSISGTIRDAIDNSVLQGATVTLSPSGKTTVTGNDGHYQFYDVELGNYTVSVSKADYESTSQTAAVQVGLNTTLDFTLHRATSALVVSPLSLDFGDTDTNLPIDITNTGQATMTWQLTENVTWLTCSPTSGSIPSGSKASVTITVDRTGLAKGTYTNTLVITSNDGGSQTVRFTMSVGSVNTSLPQVSLIGVDGVTDVAASFSGVLVSIGSSRVTAHGFCWSTQPTPSLEQGSHRDLGQTDEPKEFNYNVSNLTPNTTYYVRAYATNEEGTVYSGNEERFTTDAMSGRPKVETGAATQITATEASMAGNILSIGHEAGITEHGHVWSNTQSEPTTDYDHTELGATRQTGSFTSFLKNLKPGTLYYVRAYARNVYGTSYGQVVSFTTAVGDVLLTTHSVSNIIHNEATCGGRITDFQGNTIAERGVCWNTASNPTLAHAHAVSTDETYNFSVRITGLTEKTVYHVRAYVITSSGETYYGQDVLFQTTHEIFPPQTSGVTVSAIGVNRATLRATVTNDGDGTISDAGFCYSTSPNPSTADSKVSAGPTTSTFNATANGLQENTRYYVRAYATNERGTGYGDQAEFLTLQVTSPKLSDISATNVTYRSATFTGSVTSVGNGTLTEAGFVYATTHNPVITNHKLSCGQTMTLRATTSALTSETTYYIRAFATNEKGTAYSPEITITTHEQKSTDIDRTGFGNEQDWD